MKPGDTVTIYKDPITKTKPEGRATLVRFIAEVHGGEMWEVRFEGEAETYTRLVATD
jgi:hypothetical protein